MTEIDNLSRITLADLKWLFTNAKKIRANVRQLLDERKPSKWWDVVDLKEGYLSQMEQYLRGRLYLGKWITFEVEASIELDTMEIGSFLFKWSYRGTEYSKRVSVEARPSNLGLPDPVYYFVCPYCGRICRKLYTDGQVLASRWSFPHTYSQRNYSHQWREYKRVLDLLFEAEKGYPNRKEIYRGELTPFGKRLEKKLGRMRSLADNPYNILTMPSRDRGRPRKPKEPPLFLK